MGDFRTRYNTKNAKYEVKFKDKDFCKSFQRHDIHNTYVVGIHSNYHFIAYE